MATSKKAVAAVGNSSSSSSSSSFLESKDSGESVPAQGGNPQKLGVSLGGSVNTNLSNITYSAEVTGKVQQSKAEMAVLKCILNREAYLTRLMKVAKSVKKVFKPEVSDLIDFVRVGSIDVVEAVGMWRDAKGDAEAVFLWNGVNYLQKMVSDLDLLDFINPVRVWMGFPLTRNPFAVPLPLEIGKDLFSDRVVDPHHTEVKDSTDGFYVGGGVKPKAVKKDSGTPSPYLAGVPKKKEEAQVDATKFGFSEFASDDNSPAFQDSSSSFILNSEMRRIRQAETVLVREEMKWGRLERAADGSVPPTQMFMTKLATNTSNTSNMTNDLLNSTTNIGPGASNNSNYKNKNNIDNINNSSSSSGISHHDGNNKFGSLLENSVVSTAYSSVAANGKNNKFDHSHKHNPNMTAVSFLDNSLNNSVDLESSYIVDGDQFNTTATSAASSSSNPNFLNSHSSHSSHGRPASPTFGARIKEQQQVAATARSASTPHSTSSSARATPDTSGARKPKKKSLSERLAEIGALREEITRAKLALNSYDEEGGGGVAAKLKKTPSANYLMTNKTSLNANMLRAADQVQERTSVLEEDRRPASMQPFLKPLADSMGLKYEGGDATNLGHSHQVGGGGNWETQSFSGTADTDKTPLKKYEPPPQLLTSSSKTLSSSTTELGGTRDLAKGGGLGMTAPSTPESKSMANSTTDLKKQQQLQSQSQRRQITEEDVEGENGFGTTDDGNVEEKNENDVVVGGYMERDERAEREEKYNPKPKWGKFDVFAIRIQKVIRGFVIRSWVKWFRNINLAASIVCQKSVRGWLGRKRVNRIKLLFNSARAIQQMFRKFQAKEYYRTIIMTKLRHKSAKLIQKVARGIIGRRRAVDKKTLDIGILEAIAAVDPRAVSVHDVRDLGRRILNATIDPSVTYPPDEVLHLLRMAAIIIQGSNLPISTPVFGAEGKKVSADVDGETLSWYNASQLLNRSERFLRTIRIIANGPGSQPPALLVVPPTCMSIYNAQKNNHRWTLATFQNMGMGSKFCCQLFKWLDYLLVVSKRQQIFLSFIVSNYPSWLPELYLLQSSIRKCDMNIRINSRCMSVLKDQIDAAKDDKTFTGLLEKDIKLLEAENRENDEAMENLIDQADNVKQIQLDKEIQHKFFLLTQLAEAKEKFHDQALFYDATNKRATEGDRGALLELSSLRVKLTHEKHRYADLESRSRLFDLQCAKSDDRRRDAGGLPVEIVVASTGCGEGKALHLAAVARCKVMLRTSGVRSPKELPEDFIGIYNDLAANEEGTKREYNRSHTFTVDLTKKYDEARIEILLKLQREEARNMLLLKPSEAEMQEESIEDAKQEVTEKNLKLNFVRNELVNPPKHRPRPVILALSRDLPANAKIKIHTEITKLVPGTFVTVDIAKNLGLDARALQEIIDAGKSIIMSVDPGLTKITRMNFINQLEHVIKTCTPSPFVVVALGDEANKRMPSSNAATHYGVHNYDISLMKDGNIKVNLEIMSGILDELCSLAMMLEVKEIASGPTPPSAGHALIFESFFLIQACEDQRYRSLENLTAGVQWRVTSHHMKELQKMVDFIRNLKRGKAPLSVVEFLKSFVENPSWPKPDQDKQRLGSSALHLLASYVELWRETERITYERGGAPSQALSKSSVKGIQSVVFVSDSFNEEDTLSPPTEKSNLANTGWRSSVARVLRIILQDMRVVKTVRKIDDMSFNICAYREEGMVYFDAYDPSTSEIYMCNIPADKIPSLLYPSALEKERNDYASRPPQTSDEMYHRLIKLLKFEKFIAKSSNAKRVLYCNRDYTYVEKFSTVIDGHRTYLYVYEAALGEIYYTAHVPEFSSNLTCLFALDGRLKLMNKATAEKEIRALGKETVMAMKAYVTDRLRIAPSRSALVARGFESIRHGCFNDRLKVPVLHKTQGFALKVRNPGSYGKLLYRRVVKIADVRVILSVFRCMEDNSLRIAIYEPKAQLKLETTVTDFLRKMLFESTTDAYRRWSDDLLVRLKIEWRGAPFLYFDRTLAKIVKKVDSGRLRFTAYLIDEESIELRVVNPYVSETYSTVLSREDVCKIYFYNPTIDRIEKDEKVHVEEANVRDILKGLVQRTSTLSTSVADVSSKELDPVSLETPLINMIRNSEGVNKFFSRLAFLMAKVDNENYEIRISYLTSTFLKIIPINKDLSVAKSRLEKAFDLTMKYDSGALRRLPRTEDINQVIAEHKQLKMVDIPNELNALVKLQADEAMRKIEDELRAAEAADKAAKDAFLTRPDMSIDEGPPVRRKRAKTPFSNSEEEDVGMQFETEEGPSSYEVMSKDNTEMIEVDKAELSVENIERVVKGEHLVFDGGVKTTYREGTNRWFGHVAIKVYESVVWLQEWGLGRRLRFVVFEPHSSMHFEGILKNSDEIRESLGIKGAHLWDSQGSSKVKEMVIFIAKYRLEVVKVSAAYDGIEEGDKTPLVRIDFSNEKLYTASKVTPINIGGDADLEANMLKLVDVQKRGRKIFRVARRVSGILLQLTVFEMPQASGKFIIEEMAEEERRKKPGEKIVLPQDNLPSGSPVREFAENRAKVRNVKKFDAPTIRILGYDPKKKRSTITIAVPEAVYELVGGVYSSYLDPFYRKDLARMICESLLLYFPRGKDYEVIVPWTGTQKLISNAVVTSETKTNRSSAERVLKRNGGMIFRSGVRMNKLDCVVSVYSHVTNRPEDLPEDVTGAAPVLEPENTIIINVYTQGASEAEELFVGEKDQIRRIGRPAVHFPEGAARSLAIRKLCKFMRAELNPDESCDGKYKLYLELLGESSGKTTETGNLNPPHELDYQERKFAFPSMFENTFDGYCIMRKEVTILTNLEAPLTFMFTAYSRGPKDGIDRGIKVKMYEKGTIVTLILSIGAPELLRLINHFKEPNLIVDMCKAKQEADVEGESTAFSDQYEMQSEPGSAMARYKSIVNALLEIIIMDLRMLGDKPEAYVPYFKSSFG